MERNRLEAFRDGVLTIIITIMVLELKVPHSPDLAALEPLLPVFLTYLLSFIYLGIYWNNHHHLLKAAHKVISRVVEIRGDSAYRTARWLPIQRNL
jgi:uncharacterized membrane protein